jgi:hypothetical protein
MKADKSAPDTDLSSIPGEFRENYRFLTELISCKDKNNTAAEELENLVEERLCHIRGQLNRRQLKILNQFLKYAKSNDTELLSPPVPAELEASIRIRKRGTWLPWEAEAIRKIERWREDVSCITQHWNGRASSSTSPTLRLRSKSSGQL